jgi:predicted O-methyltransferase YrrM
MVIRFNNEHYCEDYWSPGGYDCTLLAGHIAGLNSNSRILDIGCGSGCASIKLWNLVRSVSLLISQCFAIDSEEKYIQMANSNTARFGVREKINFLHLDLLNLQNSIEAGHLPETYDLVIAEGGIASYVGLEEFFQLLMPLLKPESVFALSDVIFREGISSGKFKLPFEIPTGIREFYRTGGYAEAMRDRSTESQYEETFPKIGLEKIFSFHLSRSHCQKFRTNLKAHALQKTDPCQRDPAYIETMFHEEAFFNLEAQKYVAYFYLIDK